MSQQLCQNNGTSHSGNDACFHKSLSLLTLLPGYCAVVHRLLAAGDMRRRLLDIGLTPGTKVFCLGQSPLGDPIAFLIRGAVIALRKKDCQNILIDDIHPTMHLQDHHSAQEDMLWD